MNRVELSIFALSESYMSKEAFAFFLPGGMRVVVEENVFEHSFIDVFLDMLSEIECERQIERISTFSRQEILVIYAFIFMIPESSSDITRQKLLIAAMRCMDILRVL